jgi:hypothetical protein
MLPARPPGVEAVMPKQRDDEHLSPTDRRREVASILAKGVGLPAA